MKGSGFAPVPMATRTSAERSAGRRKNYNSQKALREPVLPGKPVRPGPALPLGGTPSSGAAMAPQLLPAVKFLLKGGLVGGAVYLVCEQGLLSDSERGAQALRKAREALPPAVEEWTAYVGWQLPAIPKTEFSICNSWNTGVRTVIAALSVAPTRACEYTQHGWKYLKDLMK